MEVARAYIHLSSPDAPSCPVDAAADHPCAHCGLPVGNHPIGNGPYFCCSGCMLVYDALKSAGYSDTYYNLRKITPARGIARPAKQEVDRLRLFEMDTPSFLETHTKPAGKSAREVAFFLDGVHCAACVWLVERMPFEIAGVKNARLDLARARLTLEFDPEEVPLSEAATWLSRFGYTAYPAHQQTGVKRTETERRLLIKMGICWALAGNVMLFAFALYAGLGESGFADAGDTTLATGARWASLALALIAVTYGGSEFFSKAWGSIKMSWRAKNPRGLHMDTPISLGILAGFTHSAWATMSGGTEIWFDSISVLIAALLTARWLQLRSRRLAGDASDRLLDLIPSMARRVGQLETPELVRVDALLAGDIIQVPAGEVVPVDGFAVKGSSVVDKSVLTGESKPERITAGMWVEAGVTNLQSAIEVRVSAAGKSTRVGKLLTWVRNRETSRAPVVLMADRISGYFVGILLLVALATALGWLIVDPGQVIPRVVSLLVISCPCALGMATPLAMAVASGRAARTGIYIKSDEATQQLTQINAVVLDKTGTLTEGRMSVVAHEGALSAIILAGKLEAESNHPIARAIQQWGNLKGSDLNKISCKDFEAVAGSGVKGTVAGIQLLVGRPAWVGTQVKSNPHLESVLDGYAAMGHTPVAIAASGKLMAAIAIGDQIRSDAPALLEVLNSEGIAVYLVSGDHTKVVQQVAQKLGIPSSHAHGNVSPEGKKEFIEQLRLNGHQKIAMVGDGVNDAVALQAADVGIAMEGGSTPSLVAADVFLTQSGLQPVINAMYGARRVMRVIKRNLIFSLFYNVLGASAAILGFVTPLVAAVAMPISSLVVVLASILQQPQRRKPSH